MATVDYDSEIGDTWARMVYDMTRKNPRALRYRPAVDRSEQLLANEVNRHMERIVVGTAGPVGSVGSQRPSSRRRRVTQICERCGASRGPFVEIGAVYTSDGKLTRYRCAAYCR